MNKPLGMIIKETESQLIDVCNKSGLSPIILDLIMQTVYSKVHSIAEKQSLEEEKFYVESLKSSSNETNITNNN